LKSSKLISYLIPIVIGIHSCEIINPEEEIPSYIHIAKINLSTNYATEGTNSHKITDAWVFIDDELLGAYELPVTFPVLKEGKHILKIRAGIKVNGIAATRDKYPFYDFYIDTINLVKGNIIEVNPVVKYFLQGITFAWKEDFEIGNSLTKTSNSDTIIQLIDADTSIGYLGNKSAAIYLDNTHAFFETTSSGQFELPKGPPVYLEINYKCNNEFVVGIFKNTLSQSIQLQPSLYINSSNDWNKIYVNLTNDVKAQTDAVSYEVYFGVIKDESEPYPEIYLDNIKLLHQ